MGAAFGCFLTRDDDTAERDTHARCSSTESLLDRLQRSLSPAWLSHADDGELSRTAANYRDEETDDWMSWDAFLTTNSSAAASSGSRMLSEVYSQALELGGNSFFLDAHGERVRGACLDEVEVVDGYFGVDGVRRRRRRLQPAAKLEDDADLDADDCCASTMDLDTDLDMERFLTQSSPPLSLLARDYGWPHSSTTLADLAHAEEAFGPASEPLHRELLLPAHSQSLSAIPTAAPPHSWASPATSAIPWQPDKQRALASYYINRLPRGAASSTGSLALGGISPSVAS